MNKINGYIISKKQCITDTSYFTTTYLNGNVSMVSNSSLGLSKDMTFEQYNRKYNEDLLIISPDEYEQRLIKSAVEQKKEFKEIDIETFNDAFDILPPQSWGSISGVEFFYVSERIDMNLVYWYGSFSGRYFRFVDEASTKTDCIVHRIKKLAEL